MFISMMISMIIILISSILMLINNLLSIKLISDREKNSPFECGFDPKSSARIPFSLQFFLIAIIFLIFDIEIALILPLIMTIKISNPFSFIFITFMFILILIIGLLHEWKQGALNWAY
uniref:NADH-ubiquinone oxidoreductase chain 3 n=1 Tax=Pyrocoelia analis TaxID=1453205 RepID=A0A8K1RGF2_9COLE|nr:NADH dehydrogenase subunit 3 [Pyrocoelia analis]UEN67847.1 NADH dehydrogenase subunit 3 [Pyrocoelia analis]UZG66113.1 NADH dehydrogenase subunit 3 [Pyrocoelia analis]